MSYDFGPITLAEEAAEDQFQADQEELEELREEVKRLNLLAEALYAQLDSLRGCDER